MINKNVIKGYAEVMNEMGLTGLEITEGETVIRLEKNVEKIVTNVSVPVEGFAAAPAAPTAQAPQAALPAPAPVQENYIEVTSPMIGVFYAAPAENEAPFVKVGDHVKKGDTLCIIEAMKLINEIAAEQDGVIKEICVSNAQVVEYGSLLFKMEG